MTDWSIDLTSTLVSQEDELQSPAPAASVKLQPEGSPGPDSSTASELDDFEMSYLHDMFQPDALLAPGDDAVLLDQTSPAGRRSSGASTRSARAAARAAASAEVPPRVSSAKKKF